MTTYDAWKLATPHWYSEDDWITDRDDEPEPEPDPVEEDERAVVEAADREANPTQEAAP